MWIRIGVVLSFMILMACAPAAAEAPGGGGTGTIIDSDANGGCSPNDDQAAFFVDANYDGQCVVLSIGDFPNATSTGLNDDSISSVLVGANVQVVLCPNADFGGTCETLQTDDNALSDNATIDDNAVSSLRVRN